MLISAPPLHFPVDAEVGQTSQHRHLTILLFDLLHRQFSKVASVGSGQFVYWDPTNPSACLAPDAVIKLGGNDDDFGCWKVWERGVPEVAVEVVSEHERDRDWEANLERFRQLGVSELVRFDPEVPGGAFRIWDRVAASLVERPGITGIAHSRYLNGYWVLRQDPELGPTLRLSRDAEGRQLFPTKVEAIRGEREAIRSDREAIRSDREAIRSDREAIRSVC